MLFSFPLEVDTDIQKLLTLFYSGRHFPFTLHRVYESRGCKFINRQTLWADLHEDGAEKLSSKCIKEIAIY